jgi:hypothetical protein
LNAKRNATIVATRQRVYGDIMDPAAQAILAQPQAEVQTLQASAAAAAAASATAAPPAGPLTSPVFTLAPALANTVTTYLDLTSSTGAKHFKGATEPLSTQSFDFSDAAGLKFFLDLVLNESQI